MAQNLIMENINNDDRNKRTFRNIFIQRAGIKTTSEIMAITLIKKLQEILLFYGIIGGV